MYCIIVAVAHAEFKSMSMGEYHKLYRKTENDRKVFIDVKGLFPIEEIEKSGVRYWRL